MGWNMDEKSKDQKAKLFQAMLSYGHLWATCGYYAYHQDSHDSILRCIPVGFSIFSFLYRLDTQILSVNSSQKFKVKIPFPFSKSMATNNVKHPTFSGMAVRNHRWMMFLSSNLWSNAFVKHFDSIAL